MKKTEYMVVPGEKLGVIEEFAPGQSTYTNEGVIRSKTVGLANYDSTNRKINVFTKRNPAIPAKGQIALGEIRQVQDKIAQVKLLQANDTKFKRPFSAILHVSFASKFFLKTLHNAIKPGDIIIAEIIGDKNIPYQLTTNGRGLGVVQAYCSRCGSPLILDKRQLLCNKCKTTEQRRINDNYGQFEAKIS